MSDLPNQAAAPIRYAYKASLMGPAHRFELTDQGLSWQVGARSAVWPYRDIAGIRLSYRPVWMQRHRFRADLENNDGQRMAILSTDWRTASLIAPQDREYRAFIEQLHARMNGAGSSAALIGGIGPTTHAAGVVLVTLVALAISGLFVRAILTGEFSGALFLAGFAGLFGWQIGGFVRRNRPRRYGFDDLPEMLLP
jgi:hypothetical protein